MALTAERRLRVETWNNKSFKLPTGKTAWKGGLAVYDQSAGKCIPSETGAGQTDLFCLGVFAETVANSSGADKDVVVQLKREVRVIWFANDGGGTPATANDIGKACYGLDDTTVSMSSATSTRSVVGTVWAVDATLGVAVELT